MKKNLCISATAAWMSRCCSRYHYTLYSTAQDIARTTKAAGLWWTNQLQGI